MRSTNPLIMCPGANLNKEHQYVYHLRIKALIIVLYGDLMHAGIWKNTREMPEARREAECFWHFSSVLSNSQVGTSQQSRFQGERTKRTQAGNLKTSQWDGRGRYDYAAGKFSLHEREFVRPWKIRSGNARVITDSPRQLHTWGFLVSTRERACNLAL